MGVTAIILVAVACQPQDIGENNRDAFTQAIEWMYRDQYQQMIKVVPRPEAKTATIRHAIRALGFAGRCENTKSLAELAVVMESKEQSVEASVLASLSFSTMGKFSKGAELANAAAERSPKNKYPLLARCFARYKGGLTSKAISDAKAVLKLDPKEAMAHFLLSQLLYRRGDKDESELALSRAIKAKTDYVQALAARGIGHALDGNFEEARLILTRCEEANPLAYLTFGNRALMQQARSMATDSRLAGQKLLGEALAQADKAIKLCPRHWDALGTRAYLRDISGNSTGAMRDANAAVEYSPDQADAYLGRAALFEGHGKIGEALKDARTAHRLAPSHYRALMMLGRLLAGENQHEEAIKHFNKCADSVPRYPFTYMSRGMSHFAMEDFNAAEKDFSRLVDLLPDFGVAFHWRARTYDELGDSDKARHDYAKAKQLGYVNE